MSQVTCQRWEYLSILKSFKDKRYDEKCCTVNEIMNSAILQILIFVSYIDNAHQDIRHTREKRDLTVSQ